MKRFDVMMPIVGYVSVTVEAEDERSAIAAAYEANVTVRNIEEWEMTKGCRGNVCHLPIHSPHVEEIEL